MGCFVVAEFLLTSASRGPSAIAEPLVYCTIARTYVLCHCVVICVIFNRPLFKLSAHFCCCMYFWYVQISAAYLLTGALQNHLCEDFALRHWQSNGWMYTMSPRLLLLMPRRAKALFAAAAAESLVYTMQCNKRRDKRHFTPAAEPRLPCTQ